MWGRHLRKVLIVTDPPAAPGLSPGFLRHPDIETLESRTGSSAVGAARRERPSLIIHEVGTSAADPLDGVRAFKADPETRSIPLIAVTERETGAAAIAAGADAVVGKPLVLREYWETVGRYVSLPRRRESRHTINLRFRYRAGDRLGQAFSRNISTYGAFLKTDQSLPQGSRIEVRFDLPGDPQPIECGAVVRHISPSEPEGHHTAGFAVEFEGLADADAARLDRFLRSHARRSLFGLLLGIVASSGRAG